MVIVDVLMWVVDLRYRYLQYVKFQGFRIIYLRFQAAQNSLLTKLAPQRRRHLTSALMQVALKTLTWKKMCLKEQVDWEGKILGILWIIGIFWIIGDYWIIGSWP